MPDYLSISVRFLDGTFHGRGDGGEPEWPPSPLRLFQALVAAAAARWNERTTLRHAVPALQWLERQPAPFIVAPEAARGARYRLYVPDNVGDLVAAKWSRGTAGDISEYRTEKSVQPTRLVGGDAVHYLWRLGKDPEVQPHRDTLVTAARSVTHLGWGIDLVVVDATVISEAEAAEVPGIRWHPFDEHSGLSLRIPIEGTLQDLMRRHTAFLGRVRADGFAPVAPLSRFRLAGYRNSTESPRRPVAVFALRRPDNTGYRPFDPVRKQLIVSAMLRHAAGLPKVARMLGWTNEEAGRFVLGHAEAPGQGHEPVSGARLAILPLPSIEPRGGSRSPTVSSIRRVLVTVFGAPGGSRFRRLAQALAGMDLIDERSGEPVALLSQTTGTDPVVNHYTRSASTWATVTPVVLPGYDDPRKLRRRLRPETASKLTADEKKSIVGKLDSRIEFLLRKSIIQAGFSKAMAQNADIDWRPGGYWPGTDLAARYAVPEQHRRFRRLHVRITWRDPKGKPVAIPGPVCLGGGRFVGLGLFAAVPEP